MSLVSFLGVAAWASTTNVLALSLRPMYFLVSRACYSTMITFIGSSRVAGGGGEGDEGVLNHSIGLVQLCQRNSY
jgi:hypothetical protein